MSDYPCILNVEGLPVEVSIERDLLFKLVVDKWFRDNGDNRFLETQYLTPESVVVDVGGYTGVWAEKIVNAYNPYLYILEPVTEFNSVLDRKFQDISKVEILKYGLGKSGQRTIDVNSDASSLYLSGGSSSSSSVKSEVITIKCFDDFIGENEIEHIDLLQINIEGGEYVLLDQILKSPFLRRIRKLQIQFHLHVAEAPDLRSQLRSRMALTHKELFNYPFVWEAWEALPY